MIDQQMATNISFLCPKFGLSDNTEERILLIGRDFHEPHRLIELPGNRHVNQGIELHAPAADGGRT